MHANRPVEHIVGIPDLTVVLVHGRALTPDYMWALADRLALDNVRYLFPDADGHSWYPKGFMAALAENEPFLPAALVQYERLVAGLLATDTPLDRLVLGGFSQGACLTAEYLARYPRRYAGAIIWTGGFIGPPGTFPPQRRELAGMPVYLTTSSVDQFVPAGRMAETEAWLKASGALVHSRIFPDREHLVSDPEIAAARRLIAALR